MTTESPARQSRPRSWLLIGLGVVLVALVFMRMWSDGASGESSRPTSTARADRSPELGKPIDPKELDVRLEALQAPRPDQGDMTRNPFRFQPKAPPPPPPGPPPSANMPAPQPSGPVGPPPAPPIPLKLMGFVEMPGGGKIASLSDCKGATFPAAEGQTVDGQYRVVKIGIESIQIEYVNGKGRQTMRVEGCPPR
jgi:hypothetical protein